MFFQFSWRNFDPVVHNFETHLCLPQFWFPDYIEFTDELKQTIRQEMDKHRDCKDRQKIRYLISEGLERLKGLDEMLDMQGH